MQPIPPDTLQRLQQLQQRITDIMRTMMEARGLDPQTHSVDLQRGVIVPDEQNGQLQETEMHPAEDHAA